MVKCSRRYLIQVAVAICVGVVAASRFFASAGEAAPSNFAVVELFTSEGCSSCPPADALLGDIIAEARKGERAVYCLAFHVDYWDQQGWKDPFSSAVYSKRQQAYANAMGSARIYTPQMIVNGQAEFVGSDRRQAIHAIDAALAHAPAVEVTLRLAGDSEPPGVSRTEREGAATVTYSVRGAPKQSVLHVAVVESGLVRTVARGENAGRVLRHDNVVRAFVTVPLARGNDGTLALAMPPGIVQGKTSIVAYVQDPSTMAILGATAVGYR